MTSQKYTILYARLSQEDSRTGDSNSIINQRLILEKYAQDNGFDNTVFLSDDGYSGTNFDRPSWKQIESMIEREQVETLIVKDLSRLGREYLQVGYLTEIYFPTKGVRFIAVNDSVDSLVEGSNDFNPIRNWANELHAKESSKKVRAVKRLQAERGERSGGNAPYGYKRSDENRKKIVPDEESAAVVRRIFALCMAGKGPGQIATILKKDEVPTPNYYNYLKYGRSHPFLDMDHPYSWASTTINAILKSPTYIGHYAACRDTLISYKNKKRVKLPEDQWVVTKNTHEPLVTQEEWDIVQEIRSHKQCARIPMERENLFHGMVHCMDCGRVLKMQRARKKRKNDYLICSTYAKHGKEECSGHRIRVDELEMIVLDDLRRVTHFARMKEKQFAEHINQKNSAETRKEINALNKELTAMQKRRGELDSLFKRLYEDNVLGRITNEQFRRLSGGYNTEQKELDEAIPVIMKKLNKLKDSVANTDAFLEKAKCYKNIETLTPEILRLFIQRIEVDERSQKYSRTCEQKVRIIYRDIGEWDNAMSEDEQQPRIAPPLQAPEIVSA